MDTPKPPSDVHRTDHFKTNREDSAELHQLIVSKDNRIKCTIACNLSSKLKQVPDLKHLARILVRTCGGWFTFVGKASSTSTPVPNNKFISGVRDGKLRTMRHCGCKSILAGAEDSLKQVVEDLRSLHTASVSLNKSGHWLSRGWCKTATVIGSAPTCLTQTSMRRRSESFFAAHYGFFFSSSTSVGSHGDWAPQLHSTPLPTGKCWGTRPWSA